MSRVSGGRREEDPSSLKDTNGSWNRKRRKQDENRRSRGRREDRARGTSKKDDRVEHEMTHFLSGAGAGTLSEAKRNGSSRNSRELHVHGRRNGGKHSGACSREREVDESCVVSRKSTCEGICRRRIAWLRESGLDFVDMIVNSDNKRAPTSLIESWSNLL